mgnify:CR=1 FL=1
MEILQITPIVPCRALDKAIAFFCDVLRFEPVRRVGSHAVLRRDNVALEVRLVAERDDAPKEPVQPQNLCMKVRNIDEVYAEMAPRLATLDKAQFCKPFDQPFGQREFYVRDLDNTVLHFYEPVAQPKIVSVL